MSKIIEIYCENNSTKKKYGLGTSLNQIIEDQQITLKYPILGAMVNNELQELSYEIFRPKRVRFIDITHPDGMRMYVRSLTFVLRKAVKELFPEAVLTLEHSISKGFYCELSNLNQALTFDLIYSIGCRMREIIAADIPFVCEEILTEEVVELFEKNKLFDKAKLFRSVTDLYTSVYYLDDMVDYYYGFLVPSTGYLKVFDLIKYYEGMLLMIPKQNKIDEVEDLVQQDKLFEIFQEHNAWGEILGVGTIGSINEKVEKGEAGEMIKISEALHEKKVIEIANEIAKKRPKVVLISGPSSSGKTTFTKRLGVQLKVSGFKPIEISLDNYFVDRDKTPKDEHGEYNFEALEALDVQLFNKNLIDLIEGREIDVPKYSFEKGQSYLSGEKLKMDSHQILLIEGIHALNPNLTPLIAKDLKFKIYVSALTQVGIDGYNRIPTTDNRLLRRIIRDYQYRKYSALDTLKRWTSVRKGEDNSIFPYQEEADIMFNSALTFELGVLKRYVEPLLQGIPQNVPEYAEALRLLKFLSYFKAIPDEEIPPTSLLREFLFDSSFKY